MDTVGNEKSKQEKNHKPTQVLLHLIIMKLIMVLAGHYEPNRCKMVTKEMMIRQINEPC
jgi:hypothetical protein